MPMSAMYSAKVAGKGHHETFVPRMHDEAHARMELSGLLRGPAPVGAQ